MSKIFVVFLSRDEVFKRNAYGNTYGEVKPHGPQ